MAARTITVDFLGNTGDLEKALARAGVVAEDASKKIVGSARSAGAAAAEQAKQQGAASDEIAAAAGRAAVAFTEANAKISAAQKAAGDAAARAAKSVGASLNEQRSAYTRAIATQSEYEASSKRAAESAVKASAMQADAAKKSAAAQADAAVKSKAANDSLSKMGGKVLLGGGAAVGAAAYEGVKGMIALQKQMEMLHTQAGASQAQVDKFTKSVLNMAGALGTSPTALAESLYHVVSGGVPAAHALQVMSIAAKAAKVSGADLNDTTTALTATVFSGIKGAQDYTKAMGLLNATVGAGDMKMQNLDEAFAGPMLAVVKGYGLSLKDVGASLATFGDLNIRGADAATQLRMAVQYMAKPAATAGPLLAKMGLSVHSFSDAMAKGGLMPALQLLHQRMDAVGVKGNQMASVIGNLFTKKGASGVTILENSLSKLRQKYKAVGDGANKFGADWKATQQTVAFKMDALKATVQALADKFGAYLIPKLEAVAKATENVVQWFGKHETAARALAVVIGGTLGLAVSAYAYTKAVAFVNATKGMIGAMSKLAGNIAGVVPTILTKLGLIGTTSETTATTVETADTAITTANVGVGTSFTGVSTSAATASAEVDTQVAGMAAAVETSDEAIIAANEAAGASFTAMIPLIGAAFAAYQIFHKSIAAPATSTSSATELKSLEGKGVPSNLAQQLVQKMANSGALNQGGSGPSLFSGIGNAVGGVIQGVSGLKIPIPGGGHITVPSGASSSLASYLNGATGGSTGSTTSGSSSGSTAMGSLPANAPNWQKIAAYLHGQGLSNVAIAGILGNAAQETGGNTLAGINTADSGTGASGMGGMGFMQWTAGRRTAEMGYAKKHGESATSLTAQLGYLMTELHGGYSPALKAIQGAGSASTAASLFNKLFEGGTDPGGNREARASQAYGLLGKMNLGSVGAAAGPRKSVRSLLYANPFAGDTGVTQGRTDMGVDYSAPAGSKIGAIGAGDIVKIISNWYKGQPLVEEQLTGGPDKGKFVYYAEQLNALVKQGQKVQAGQTIGRVASSGTGLELGFGGNASGATLAQTTTGYTEGQVTPAGQAFNAFLKSVGGGKYTTTSYASGSPVTTGGGSSITATIAQFIQAMLKALNKSGTSLLTKYGNLEQNGSVTGLEKGLGVNTTSRYNTGAFGYGYRGVQASDRLTQAFGQLGANASTAQINKAGTGILQDATAGSTQQTAFNNLIEQLRATHQKGLEALATKLVAAHKAALQALSQELYAAQLNKDAESLMLQDSQLKAQTTALANSAAAQLTVVQAQAQAVSDAAQAGTQAATDQAKYVSDQAQAQTTYVKDMTQTASDQFNAMATAIKDQTAINTDRSSGIASAITDQTQITVDTLNERGLFGLNLVAQQLTVQLDVMKAGYDAQINAAQQQLDVLQLQADVQESAAQIALDQATTAADQLTALAQNNLDTVTMVQDSRVAAAQQHADSVTIQQDQNIAKAQAHVDAVTAVQDSKVSTLQQSADLSSGAPKSIQDKIAAELKDATAGASVAIDRANNALTSTTNTANAIISGATTNYTNVQNGANAAINAASNAYTAASDSANNTIATATANLTDVTGSFTLALNSASDSLATLEGTASVAEAGAAGNVAVMGARASTEFAGSGTTVNIYGLPTTDANAVADAVGWQLRTQPA